jgi:hypothetical protein
MGTMKMVVMNYEKERTMKSLIAMVKLRYSEAGLDSSTAVSTL